jgi:hypothetical protein
MTPIVPFDPTARSPFKRAQMSLRDVYSEDTMRSFVSKLRELAVEHPDGCEKLFRVLDDMLALMLRDAREGAVTFTCGLRVVGKLLRATERVPGVLFTIEDIIDDLNGEKGGA